MSYLLYLPTMSIGCAKSLNKHLMSTYYVSGPMPDPEKYNSEQAKNISGASTQTLVVCRIPEETLLKCRSQGPIPDRLSGVLGGAQEWAPLVKCCPVEI